MLQGIRKNVPLTLFLLGDSY